MEGGHHAHGHIQHQRDRCPRFRMLFIYLIKNPKFVRKGHKSGERPFHSLHLVRQDNILRSIIEGKGHLRHCIAGRGQGQRFKNRRR